MEVKLLGISILFAALINIGALGTARAQVGITSFFPSTALAGGELTINGSGFSTVIADNTVEILGEQVGAVRAQVVAASTNQLRVLAPFGAASGQIQVISPAGSAISAASLQIRTSLSGFIEEAFTAPSGLIRRRGIASLTVRVQPATGPVLTQTTDIHGSFLFADLAPGRALLDIDAAASGLPYPSMRLAMMVTAGRDNQYPSAIELTQRDGSSVSVNAGQQGGMLTTVGQTTNRTTSFGLPSGSQVIQPPNVSTNLLILSLFNVARTPLPLPVGAFSSLIAQITPFGARIVPGGTLRLGNPENIPLGAPVKLYRLDQPTAQVSDSPTIGQFIEVGIGNVINSSRIEAIETGQTAANGITQTSYYFAAPAGFSIATVAGRIIDTDGKPISRATVRVRGQSTFSGNDGSFALQNIPLIRANDSVALDISFMRPDRAIDRATSSAVSITASGSHNLPADVITETGTESDVAPRVEGNGQVSLADWVQTGRFAAALDTVAGGPEFRRTDCAPMATGGDGRITLADWVQAGRYAAALDPIRQASGPTAPTSFALNSADSAIRSAQSRERIPESARRVLLSPMPSRSADELLYAVTLHGRGDENGLAFSIEFDPEAMSFEGATAGDQATIFVNSVNVGRVGVAMALQPGETFGAGESQVLVFRFRMTGVRASSVNFVDLPVAGEVVSVNAEVLPAVFGAEVGRNSRK